VEDYQTTEIIISGCPRNEGVARHKGIIGAALATNWSRGQFYKLTNFGINAPFFDLGDPIIPAVRRNSKAELPFTNLSARLNKKPVEKFDWSKKEFLF